MTLWNKIKKYLKIKDAWITVILVLGILAMVNFFSYQMFSRLDLTRSNIYSISDVSKETVEDLDDVVRIKIYFSKDLPNQYADQESQVNDFLSEYVNYSRGKVKLERKDPDSLEEPQRELAGMGIPQMRFNVMKEGSYQVTNGYMGIAVQYGDEVESVPVVKDTRNLEYEITSAIKKVTQEEPPEVALITDHGSLTAENGGLETAKEKLEDVYEVQEVELASEAIPETTKTVVLPGPTERLGAEEVEKLDSFVSQGGSLVLLVDGVTVEEGPKGTSNDTGINAFLEDRGLRLNNNVVLDESSAIVSFNSGRFAFRSRYPAWVKVQKENFDSDNAAVADLESITLPWPSSVDITGTTSERYTVLARTTSNSWTQEDDYKLEPDSDLSPEEETDQYNLAVMTADKAEDVYSGEAEESGRVILVGDSDFVRERFLNQNRDNLVFFQNLVDSVTLDNDLIKIRSKEISDRPLRDISPVAQTTLKYLNIFGLPVVIVIFGLVRYYIRKRRT